MSTFPEKIMCLHPRPVDPVPEDTARIARAAFPKGTPYMAMRDALGAIFEDEDFAHLFPRRGPAGDGTVEACPGHHHAVRRRPL
jgi:hypothetical protein